MDKNIWQSEIIQVGSYTLVTSQLISFVIIVFGTFIVASILRKAFHRITEKEGAITGAHIYIIARLINYSIYVVGLLFALSALGIDVGKLALVASALAVSYTHLTLPTIYSV